MIWTKRRLLIAVAMSDTLTSKQFFKRYLRSWGFEVFAA